MIRPSHAFVIERKSKRFFKARKTMFFWPWIDSLLRRVTKCKEISVYIGIVATLLLIGLTVWEAVAAH